MGPVGYKRLLLQTVSPKSVVTVSQTIGYKRCLQNLLLLFHKQLVTNGVSKICCYCFTNNLSMGYKRCLQKSVVTKECNE